MSEMLYANAADLDDAQWLELRLLQREAFTASIGPVVGEAAVDALVSWHDKDCYIASHRDPNTEVGRRFVDNQEFSNSRVAIARQDGRAIAYGYVADNVSGADERVREVKRLSVVKNYLWLREIAVAPAQWRQQRATEVGRRLLEDVSGLRSITTYIWPVLMPWMQPELEGLGFKETDSSPVTTFPQVGQTVQQVRMQGRVGTVRRKLAQA